MCYARNTCATTHSHVWQDQFTSVLWLITYIFYMQPKSFTCMAQLTHTCDMTQSYVCHDSFVCVTVLILWECMCWFYECVCALFMSVTYAWVCHTHECDTQRIRRWVTHDVAVVAVCCSVVQCVAVCCSVMWIRRATHIKESWHTLCVAVSGE